MQNQEKRITPEQIVERAKHYFVEKGKSCSEACVMAGAEALGIKNPLLPDIAIGFAGGIGMQGDVCGAVAGCVMALSLAAAQKTKDYAGQKKLIMPAVARLYRKFTEQCGSARCADICGLDLTTPVGIAQLISGVRSEKCVPAVAIAANLLASELGQLPETCS
jgi:C_GCAxxG_C_C family probable redox protein